MTEIEKALLQTLESHPGDWSVRFLLVDKMLDREAKDEAVALICAAPVPPEKRDELSRIAEIAGESALPLVRAYVEKNPSDSHGYKILARLLEGGEKDTPEPTLDSEQGYSQEQHAAQRETPAADPGQQAQTGVPKQESPVQPLENATASVAGTPLLEDHPQKQAGSKATAILIAVGVHVLIALIAALVVILPAGKDEPEIVAAVIGPVRKKQEMRKKNVVKQTKKSSASSAAAAPIAQLMRANAVARIAMPKITKTSTGPLGIGDADFGGGGFGSGGDGLGSGSTMFGSSSTGGLVGTLYDMKQDRKKKPVAYDPGTYYPRIREVVKGKFSEAALAPYYKAKVKLGFTFLVVPSMSANAGPKAFQAEKEIQPRGWFVIYKGKLSVPETGLWRFHGIFDDLLIVFVNGRPVLDSSWVSALGDKKVKEVSKLPRFIPYRPVYSGKWVNLKQGDEFTIILGEHPGGKVGGTLMVERKGEKYKKRANGSPILPLFSIGKISDEDWKRVAASGYQFERKTPAFLPSK